MSLAALKDRPFELLLELERRAADAVARREGSRDAIEEWVGLAFKLGKDAFVAARTEVREVLPLPDSIARVPGAKAWLRGVANVRGQLLTLVDFRAYLGAGAATPDRHSRVLVVASREVPTGLIVDEVLGFRRFGKQDFRSEPPATVTRCERYLSGGFVSAGDAFARFSLVRLLDDKQFLDAGRRL